MLHFVRKRSKTMEINKIVKKIDNLNVSLYNAINDDIDYLCTKLCQELDIFKRGTKKNLISHEELKQLMQMYLNINLETKFCQGITSQNNRCTRKAKPHSKYCQIHSSKYHLLASQKNTLCNSNKTTFPVNHYDSFNDIDIDIDNNIDNKMKDVVLVTQLQTNTTNKTNLKTKFLGDKFYHIDDKYIYEKKTFEKVGYISVNENGESEYILTDDPFILEELGI